MKETIKTDSGKAEDIYQETKRGCGWRKIGGFYLIGSGMPVSCDALPIDLDPCGECGYEVPFSRNMQMVHSAYLTPKILFKHASPNIARRDGKEVLKNCKDNLPCPICTLTFGKKFALMEVSSSAYTPESFIKEANKYGISKRINPHILPNDFKLGETWVFLAHRDAIQVKEPKFLEGAETKHKRGIFYAFRPVRIEAMVKDNENPERIKELEDEGYNIVKLPHDDPKHQQKPKKTKKEKKPAVEEEDYSDEELRNADA